MKNIKRKLRVLFKVKQSFIFLGGGCVTDQCQYQGGFVH